MMLEDHSKDKCLKCKAPFTECTEMVVVELVNSSPSTFKPVIEMVDGREQFLIVAAADREECGDEIPAPESMTEKDDQFVMCRACFFDTFKGIFPEKFN